MAEHKWTLLDLATAASAVEEFDPLNEHAEPRMTQSTGAGRLRPLHHNLIDDSPIIGGPLTVPAESVSRPLGGPVGKPAMNVGEPVKGAGGPVVRAGEPVTRAGWSCGEQMAQPDAADENFRRWMTTTKEAATNTDTATPFVWAD